MAVWGPLVGVLIDHRYNWLQCKVLWFSQDIFIHRPAINDHVDGWVGGSMLVLITDKGREQSTLANKLAVDQEGLMEHKDAPTYSIEYCKEKIENYENIVKSNEVAEVQNIPSVLQVAISSPI